MSVYQYLHLSENNNLQFNQFDLVENGKQAGGIFAMVL